MKYALFCGLAILAGCSYQINSANEQIGACPRHGADRIDVNSIHDIFAVVKPTTYKGAWLDIQPDELRFFGFDGENEFSGELAITCESFRFFPEGTERHPLRKLLRKVNAWQRQGLALMLLDSNNQVVMELKKVD